MIRSLRHGKDIRVSGSDAWEARFLLSRPVGLLLHPSKTLRLSREGWDASADAKYFASENIR